MCARGMWYVCVYVASILVLLFSSCVQCQYDFVNTIFDCQQIQAGVFTEQIGATERMYECLLMMFAHLSTWLLHTFMLFTIVFAQVLVHQRSNNSTTTILPTAKFSIPADYRFVDTYYEIISHNLYVEIGAANVTQGNNVLVLPQLAFLVPDYSRQCALNISKKYLCFDQVEHTLRFSLESDSQKRSFLVVLFRDDNLLRVANQAAALMGMDIVELCEW